jgi:hypothetical protein
MLGNVKEISLEKRDCDVCCSNDLEPLWSYEKNVYTNESSKGYLFKVNNVICKNCGFTFVSPCFNEELLADYYASSLRSPTDQPVDYDINFRLDVIHKYLPETIGPKFIEIGPSTLGEFQSRVRKNFEYIGVEPSREFGGRWKSVQDLKEENLADIVAHYFVLEHISNPLTFLKQCNRLLKMNATMIIEVPNIDLYPKDPVAQYLFEHQNHFSAKTLESLANSAGFEQLEYSEMSSRTFGMTAIFKKSSEVTENTVASNAGWPAEYDRNRKLFMSGLDRIKEYIVNLSAAKDFIEQTKYESIVLWGANQNLLDFLAHAYPDSKIPVLITFIDSDPRKHRLVADYDGCSGKMVQVPSDCVDALRKSSKIIIFARRHKDAILQQIENLAGKLYKNENILTVDINP